MCRAYNHKGKKEKGLKNLNFIIKKTSENLEKRKLRITGNIINGYY